MDLLIRNVVFEMNGRLAVNSDPSFFDPQKQVPYRASAFFTEVGVCALIGTWFCRDQQMETDEASEMTEETKIHIFSAEFAMIVLSRKRNKEEWICLRFKRKDLGSGTRV